MTNKYQGGTLNRINDRISLRLGKSRALRLQKICESIKIRNMSKVIQILIDERYESIFEGKQQEYKTFLNQYKGDMEMMLQAMAYILFESVCSSRGVFELVLASQGKGKATQFIKDIRQKASSQVQKYKSKMNG